MRVVQSYVFSLLDASRVKYVDQTSVVAKQLVSLCPISAAALFEVNVFQSFPCGNMPS